MTQSELVEMAANAVELLAWVRCELILAAEELRQPRPKTEGIAAQLGFVSSEIDELLNTCSTWTITALEPEDLEALAKEEG